MSDLSHISIDCETLGVSTNNPAILSIGAVLFDPVTGQQSTQQYLVVDIDDAIRHGHVDGSTVAWWVSANPSAKKLLVEENKLMLRDALDALAKFVRSVRGARVWFNGPGEDGAWLKSAYNAVGLEVPWCYRNQRDFRTLIEIADLQLSSVPSEGTAHNALDDAKWQARAIAAAFAKLREQRGIHEAVTTLQEKVEQEKTSKSKRTPVIDDDDEL